MTLEDAIALAARAHAGQRDKAGAPYILHPLRVMLAQEDDLARKAAVLHDVVEDTDITLADLQAAGAEDALLDAVALLTHPADMAYEDYVDRLALSPIARAVKRADLADNMDLARIASPTDRDRARLDRYRRALARLEAAAPPPGA